MKHTLLSRAAAFIATLALLMSYGAPLAVAASVTTSATSVDANTLAITLSGLTANLTVADAFSVNVANLKTGAPVDISGATATTGVASDGTFSTVDIGTGMKFTVTAAGAAPNKVITITSAGEFPITADYLVTVIVDANVTPADVGDIGSVSVFKANQNQVAVTATVVPILSMSLSANSIAFGQLVVDTIANSNHTIDVDTNATTGYTLNVQNTANGLYDGTNTIPDVTNNLNLTGGAAYGYGVNAQKTGASTITAPYAGANNTDVSPLPGAVATSLATNGAAIAGEVVTVNYYAKVDATQEAGNYADTVTYTITGNF